MAQANDGGPEYVLVEGAELGQGSGQGEESLDVQGEDNTEQGPQLNSETQDNQRTEDQQTRGNYTDPTILMLRDAIVGAMQQRPNPTVTPVTPMLPIVTAMKNLKTPYFEGSTDPIEADQWIRKLERNLETSMCPENLKKRIGTYYLDKDAAEWWTSRVDQLEQPVTWQVFKTEFERKYFPPEARLRLQRQFLNLRQEDKTVREYEAEFMRLRRHALPGQKDEQAMITNFMFGVRPELESRLAVGTYNSLTELIEKAVNVENGLNAEKAARKEFYQNKAGKNKMGSQNPRGKGKEQAITRKENPFTGECYNCGKKGHRARDCRSKGTSNPMQGKKVVECFTCHQLGHYSYECPMKNPIPAKPINTRPPPALPSNEPVPKRQALGGRVYNLGIDEDRAPGPAQGPIAGNTSI